MAMNTMDAEVGRLLEAGKNSARNGDTVAARAYLTQVVERDPHNEQAWMWLSGVATEPEEQQICLENVLVINPHNTKARKGLDFLSARTGIPTQAPPVPPESTSPVSVVTAPGATQTPMGGDPMSQIDFGMPASAVPVVGMPDFSGDFALPPWMENGAVPDPLAGAGSGPTHEGMLSAGSSESLAFDMFASTPQGAQPTQDDPWAGLNLSSDSLNIDWSRGMDASPSASEGRTTFDQQQNWGGLDPYQPGNPDNGAGPNSFADWTMDNVPGFEPLEPGSLGFGQADATPYTDMAQGGYAQAHTETAPGDWQNGHSNVAYGPMGPAGDFQLPTPSDLPGFDMSSQSEVKPWYAQSSQLSPGMLPDAASVHGFGMENPDEMTQHLAAPKKDQVMVTCPHCSEQVPDTSLSCTRCGFSFFVNCPHCHELVDVIDAKADVAEPCPYCNNSIEKMKLGMTSANPAMNYSSERPVKPEAVAPAMKQYMKDATRRRGGFTWAWVVDVMWLVAVVMMVWVLTQLPAWWHLSGQY